MSNLLKSFSVICNSEDKLVMDYNSKVAERITEYQNQSNKTSDGFVAGLGNIVIDTDGENIIGGQFYTTDDEECLTNDVAMESTRDEEEQAIKEAELERVSQAKKQAEGIVEVAREDARIIVTSATNEAETIRQNAWNEGYSDGEAKAKAAVEETLKVRMQELEDKEKQLVMEYNNMVAELEPKLAEAIFTVISDITKVVAEDKKEVILQLVNTVLSDNPMGRNFFIRVSKEDADFLRENKDKLVGVTNKDINIEIIADSVMKPTECLIETDYGVFDSSLDIQLSNLAKDIKLLACAIGNN